MTGLEGSGPAHSRAASSDWSRSARGAVTLDGKPYAAASPATALRQGLAYLPRDRHGLGIVAIRSVRDNVSLSSCAS